MLIFRLIYLIVLPVLLAGRLAAVLRGRERWADLWTRLTGPAVPKGAIWVHGASVGELTSARPILAGLHDHKLIVTANTTTGRDRVASWGMAHVSAALAPLDFSRPARRMAGQAAALIILENELWPQRILAAHQVGIPVIALSARMSDRAARRWGKFAGLARRLLGPVALIIPQDAASARNLLGLGANPTAMAKPMTLKAAYSIDDSPAEADMPFTPASTILAASTHAGEEELVLDAFQKVLSQRPDLRLILAPRHPDRAASIAPLVQDRGLSMAQRSVAPPADVQVYLADTLGEMALWYRRAGVAFLGGSLVDKGGHTPFEPIAHGCPVLHGPSTRNFADIYDRLDSAGGAVSVTDAASLADAMLAHLADAGMTRIARQTAGTVDLTPVIAQIKDALSAPPTR